MAPPIVFFSWVTWVLCEDSSVSVAVTLFPRLVTEEAEALVARPLVELLTVFSSVVVLLATEEIELPCWLTVELMDSNAVEVAAIAALLTLPLSLHPLARLAYSHCGLANSKTPDAVAAPDAAWTRKYTLSLAALAGATEANDSRDPASSTGNTLVAGAPMPAPAALTHW